MGFFGGGGSSVDLASPSAIGSTTPNTGAFTTLSFAPANNTTGFSNTGNSLTGSNAQSLISLAQTWNTTGTPSAITLNITDTASNASSRFLSLQFSGTTVYSFGKGTLSISAPSGVASSIRINSTATNPTTGTAGPNPIDVFNSAGTRRAFIRADGLIAGSQIGTLDDQSAALVDAGGEGVNWPRGLNLNENSILGWGSTNWWSTKDVILRRDAANILAQRNGTNAQTFRLYRTYTDASNYERLALSSTGTTRFSILAEKAGTGADRQIEISFYTAASDPTSTDIASGCFGVWKNSGTGTIKLWANDGGTMKSVALA
ncbi:MAG: hypothetical protein EBR82_42595 [Caulobacteraceae bacterium]|nr:hypothetical protein [Caulobacteraceae bacterium]